MKELLEFKTTSEEKQVESLAKLVWVVREWMAEIVKKSRAEKTQRRVIK